MADKKTTFTGKAPAGGSRSKKPKKERNARTHRLIQEGAILESVAPHVREMDLDLLKRELLIRLRGL